MKSIIRLSDIIKLIRKFEKKRLINRKEKTKLEKALKKIDQDKCLLEHIDSRIRRIILRYLEE